jgi:ribose transport system permease protein
MTAAVLPKQLRGGRTDSRRIWRALLPGLSLILVILSIVWFNPRAISYLGFNLMLNLATPVALATIAQMCLLGINDIDLSTGAYVGFVACVTATWLPVSPILGVLTLIGCVAAYACMGALIHLRRLPSIVVTLGMSFVWLGLAILLRPTPGGTSPAWLSAFMSLSTPWIPLPIVLAAALAGITHLLLVRSSYGTILRGAGGNRDAVARAGWSMLKARVTMYGLAGFFGALSGMTLVGVTTSADANMANGYTLLSIAAAILGGAEFTGGRISPVGAVIGALTLQLITSALSFFYLPQFPALRIPPEWQVGAQGIILILILAIRAFINKRNP